MDILLVTDTVDDPCAGVSVCVRELARELAAQGHAITVQSTASPTPLPLDDSVTRVRRARVVGPAAIGYAPDAERWAASADAGRFEIVHQHALWRAISRTTARWRSTHRRPTVISPHGALVPRARARARGKKLLALLGYERANLRSADCLVATGEEEVAGFRDAGLSNPVAVIPNGVSSAWLETRGDPARFAAGRPALLYLSRVHPTKGLLELVEALPPHAHLTIAGPVVDVAYAAAARRRIDQLGLGARVRWTGPLIGQAKRDAFAAADLFVLPTHSDNFGLVVAEALGAGVPVVTTRHALPWHRLNTHRCGWWVAPEALAETLRLAAGAGARELVAMGTRGRALVTREFRWCDAAARSAELYRWLLGGGPCPSFVIRD